MTARTLARVFSMLGVPTLLSAQVPPSPPDRALMDTSCSPCRDFYRYANGGWLDRTRVPATAVSWSPFNEVRDRNDALLREILERAARTAEVASDPDVRKLGRFYATCVDSVAAESAGTTPLRPELDLIAALRTRAGVRSAVARLHAEGRGVLFAFTAAPDARNSSRLVADFGQGGLGLPGRDPYLREDSLSRRARLDYAAHAAALFRLAGASEAVAHADAQRVLTLETLLARASLSPVELRNPDNEYRWMAVADADTMAPGFGWRGFLDGVGAERVDSVDVSHPTFFRVLGRALEERPLEEWRAYLRLRLLSEAAPWLSAPFQAEAFRFASASTGARAPLPRARRCLRLADRWLGDALGREFVRTAFTSEAQARMNGMVDNLQSVLAERIAAAPWMSSTTRAEALQKLSAMGRKIGSPQHWQDYGALEVDTGAFVLNLYHVQRFHGRRTIARIGAPVDRREWRNTPPTVNASYSTALNEISFPAGRVQPPFFDILYDDAANYGGIAATIGHEMVHGFDDEGRRFDARGNLRDWWAPADAAYFTGLAARLERQYGTYAVLDSVYLDGKMGLGENIADLGGVVVAYHALQRALGRTPRIRVDGFTPEQRFFLAFAQARRAVYRPEELRQMASAPHAPNEFRVNGPLSNLPEFARAFGCRPGDPMVRPDSERVSIW